MYFETDGVFVKNSICQSLRAQFFLRYKPKILSLQIITTLVSKLIYFVKKFMYLVKYKKKKSNKVDVSR